MKGKIAAILIVSILLCGCVAQIKETTKRYTLRYSTETIKLFDMNGTAYEIGPYPITLPQNVTNLHFEVTWDASFEMVLTNDGDMIPHTHNFTYHVELFPPEQNLTTCYPSNRTSSSTDLQNRNGILRIDCGLNEVPENITSYAGSRTTLEQRQVNGHIGAGRWNYTMEITPRFWCGNSHASTHWGILVEMTSYHYTIEEAR